MMKKTILFCFLFLFKTYIYSQEMPIDFSDNADVFNTWGGSTFVIVPGPVDSNNDTGQFFRSSSPNEQGHYIDLITPVDLDVEDEITLRFYSFDPNSHTIVVKLEDTLNSNPAVEVSQTTTSNNVWIGLTFDFSTVSGTGQYNRLVIRIDDGSTIPGAFRIDDINNGSTATDPHALDVIYDVLVWSDEFDIDGPVDSSKWYHQTFGPNGGQWFNGEQQHYTNRIENSSVSNGNLVITAKKETFTQDGVTLNYTSARLNSKFAFTYGRIDVRAKLPFGDGTWPAIWTLGRNINETGAYWQTQGFGTTTWPACGEIDIMEHGLGAVNHTSSAIHTPSSFGATVNTASQQISDVANNYHVYSVNWSPNQITFLVDNIGFYTYKPSEQNDSTWPFYLEQFLLLNVAMGGVAGTIDSAFTESSMEVDYVRIYQSQEILSTEEFSKLSVQVFPNPTSNFVNVKSLEIIDTIKLFNLLGRQVLIKKIDNKNYRLDVSNLSKGIYLLDIYSGVKKDTQKIIIR